MMNKKIAENLVKQIEDLRDLCGVSYSDDFIEELADVIVMILQFESIMSRPDSELLQRTVTEKLDRQLKRIEGGT